MDELNFTREELCLIAILREKKQATTAEILSMTAKFPKLCDMCASGSQVIVAGRKLERKGIVRKKIAKGGFIWELSNDPGVEIPKN